MTGPLPSDPAEPEPSKLATAAGLSTMAAPARVASPAGPPHRWRIVAGLVVLAVMVAAVLAVARQSETLSASPVGPQPGAAAGAAAAGAFSTTTEATTTEPPPTLAVEPVDEEPVPDAPPADAYPPGPPVKIGTVSIPKFGVSVDLFETITLTAIDPGSGHWPGTPMPGGRGNMVIAGHRTLHHKPFNRLDELVEGDKVVFTDSEGKTFTYGVRGVVIVPAAAIGIASQTKAHVATLFACHPKGQATHRVVAKLRLLDDEGKPVDADEDLPPMDIGTRGATDTTLKVRANPDGTPAQSADPLSAAKQ